MHTSARKSAVNVAFIKLKKVLSLIYLTAIPLSYDTILLISLATKILSGDESVDRTRLTVHPASNLYTKLGQPPPGFICVLNA